MGNFAELFMSSLGRPPAADISLGEHSSFKIGGPADFFFEALSAEELKLAVRLARRQGLRYFLIGGGTNILFDDAGYRGLIVKNSARGVAQVGEDAVLETLSGTSLADFVDCAASYGLTGLEFMTGIPGTVGGAVFGNAGAFGRSIGQMVLEAVLFDPNDREISIARGHLAFSYRYSSLRQKRIVLLKARFRLQPGQEKKIRADMDCFLIQRKSRQPAWPTACAGCYFKNPARPDGTRISAGKLLEEVGAGEMSVGDASVSTAHCNFIVNRGKAKAADVLSLAEDLKRKVRERFSLELEEEVIRLAATDSML
jgi:UDP-N-acetylmuramate dehydrogenase